MKGLSSIKPGVELGGFRLLEPRARGGMGAIFNALQLSTGKHAAVKIQLIADETAQARFAREVDAIRRIAHPNVVKLLGAGREELDDGAVDWMAMELVEGHNLQELLERLGPLPPATACEIVRHAALGLAAAHAQGIVHRDIKPENIMVTPEGWVVVVDFGIAAVHGGEKLTQAGMVLGTGRYMPPEVLAHAPQDARGDIFALGAVLFLLVTGEHLRAQHNIEVLYPALQSGEDLRRVAEKKSLPVGVRKILHNALAPNPDHRYATAAALERALASVVAQEAPGVDGKEHIALVLDALTGSKGITVPTEKTDEHAVLPTPAAAGMRAPPSRKLPVVPIAVVAAVLVLVGGWLVARRPQKAPVAAPAPVKQPVTTSKTSDDEELRATVRALREQAGNTQVRGTTSQPGQVTTENVSDRPATQPMQHAAVPLTETPRSAVPSTSAPVKNDGLYATEKNVENQALRVGEESREDPRQRAYRECILNAQVMGHSPETCPPPK